MAGQCGQGAATSPGFVAGLAAAIDACAVAVTDRCDAGNHVAAQLASAWALVTSADPELAARAAQYSGSLAGDEPAQARVRQSAADERSAGGDLDLKPGTHVGVQPD
jgi:hypothetical protein